MYQVSSEQHRSIISAILRSPVRPPKSMRSLDWRGFLQTYIANVDAKDLADRDPKDLAAAALSHLMFARRRGRAALVRVFNPTLREHGFVSPHTIIDVVNDDMPFLVDSINLALTERALTLHLLAHPVFAVTRNRAGDLDALQKRTETAEGTEAAPGVLPASRDRSNRRSGGAEIPGKSDRAQFARCAHGLRGLGPHARGGPHGGAGFGRDERARRCDRTQRDLCAARLDGESAFHLSRLSRIPADGRQGPRAAAGGRIQRARHPAARAQKTGHHDPGAAQRYPPTKPLAQFEPGDEGQFLVHGAPRRLSGLCRHQAIRLPRALDRRAAFPRSLDLRRVQRQSARDSRVAPENRARVRTLRLGARQPRWQGAAAHSGVLSPR